VAKKLIEAAKSGATMSACAAIVGINKGTFGRWLHEGKGNDPRKKAQRRLRAHIMRARAHAEIEALKHIEIASRDPANWRAACWMLTHVIRGRYLMTARDVNRTNVELTVADVARAIQLHEESIESANGDHHQNGEMINGREVLTGIGSNRVWPTEMELDLNGDGHHGPVPSSEWEAPESLSTTMPPDPWSEPGEDSRSSD
jgi:hypothetical protein